MFVIHSSSEVLTASFFFNKSVLHVDKVWSMVKIRYQNEDEKIPHHIKTRFDIVTLYKCGLSFFEVVYKLTLLRPSIQGLCATSYCSVILFQLLQNYVVNAGRYVMNRYPQRKIRVFHKLMEIM